MHGDFFGWCSLRQQNWRLNSGLKSATIVTDPLNIHIFVMECTRKLKFGMMIYHYFVDSFGYSMMPYDLDGNFQGHWYWV